MFAIPNTIGTYEPVLLRGSASRAFLSTPAALHVRGTCGSGKTIWDGVKTCLGQNLFPEKNVG